jgi:hypothetical protein
VKVPDEKGIANHLVPESCGETVRPSRSVDRGTCGSGIDVEKTLLGSADAIKTCAEGETGRAEKREAREGSP